MKTKTWLLLITIFLIYVGTGNANVMLGSAWPAISADIGVPVSWQSIVIVIFYIGAALGGATAQNLLARLRTWVPAVAGIVLILINIFIFSATASFPLMVVCSVIIGYSIGLEAAIVNGYVARHYSATAMNWLHCFYGIGCTMAPTVLSYFISVKDSWRMGYQMIGVIEIGVLVVLVVSVPLWRVHGPVFPRLRNAADDAGDTSLRHVVVAKPLGELIKLPGSLVIVFTMYVYCSFEVSINCWATSFLTTERGLAAGAAAGMMTLYFGAQVAGRIINGFLTRKYPDRRLIRIFLIATIIATVLFVIAPDSLIAPVFIILGFATGPMFPLLIHEIPSIVGDENAQGVIGLQTAAANLGNASLPVIIGIVAGRFGFKVFPVFLIVLIFLSMLLKSAQDRGNEPREVAGGDV